MIKVGNDNNPVKLPQHLIPIEVDRVDDEQTATEDISTNDCVEDLSPLITRDMEIATDSGRPRRRAAIDGEVWQRVWTGTY